MLEVYFGNDTNTVRRTARDRSEVVAATGATVTTIDGDSYVPGLLNDAVGATSLFGEQFCFILDTPSSDAVFQEDVTDQLAALAESAHTFIVIEGVLLAAAKKPYAKHAVTMEEFKAAAAERYNVFAMADSLSRKDKRQLWLQLQEARAAGLSAEEIIGTLWWQLKTLRLAALTKTAGEAGMKDFPYNKAKRALSSFKDGEVEQISDRLLTLYHDGHLGLTNIDLALEKFVLML